MIAVRVVPENDFDIRKLKPQLINRLFNRWDIPFVRTVNKEVAALSNHEEGTECPRPGIVNIADDLMRRELRSLVFRCAHVAREYGTRGIRASLDCHAG
jgi:hypothetical protein